MTLDVRIESKYKTKYISGDALPDDGLVVQIKDVVEETVVNPKNGSSSEEVVLYFEGDNKRLVLGARCNMDSVKKSTGTSNTKEWVGKKIGLYKQRGTWFGKTGFAVRVHEVPIK